MNKSSDVICVKNTTNFIKGVKYKAIKLSYNRIYIDGFSNGINKSNFSFLDGTTININNFSVDDRILIYNESNIFRFKNTYIKCVANIGKYLKKTNIILLKMFQILVINITPDLK